MSCSISPTHPPAPANVANTDIAMKLAAMQRSYQSALDDGDSAGTLANMAKQITNTAAELGLNVALPQASGTKIDLQA